MKANLTVSLAIGLAIHVTKEVCDTADLDMHDGRTLGASAQLAAHNLRDLVCGMPKAERQMILSTVREYTRRYIHRYRYGSSARRALRSRIFACFRHARDLFPSHA